MSAEWVLPGDGRTIHRGVLAGRGPAIEAVGTPQQVPRAPRHRSLARAAILPGLVNTHTHLELTTVRGQIPARRPIVQWLYALQTRWPTAREQAVGIEQGAAEALAAGTTALADCCHSNRGWRILKDSPLRKLCFVEVTGIGPGAEAAMGKLRKNIRGARASRRLRLGIAPHAPYSVAEDVCRQAVQLANKRRWPVLTHLAESESERQFLLRGSGKLFDFLAHMGMMDSSVAIAGCTPVAFAQRVGMLDGPCLLVHVNFIDDAEMKTLAASAASVVLCPRANDYFGRTGHRYAEMLAAGINVALGTDSLASNTSLDLLAEMRRLRAEAKVSNQTILSMGTINGAKALGWEEEIGSLAPGKQADWIAVELPPNCAAPLEAILTGEARVLEVAIAGQTVFVAGEEQSR